MKLKIPQVYSQRNPQWASVLLGYNTQSQYNIGMYGCLITSLSMLVGQTPDVTNQQLKDNNGFTSNGGDFIWSKCTVLGLKSNYVSSVYNGPVSSQGITTAKTYLDQGFPLLCEIDFNPATIGEEMHFVEVIGYDDNGFIMADPWTGNVGYMDAYGGFQRAIIQFRVYDKKLSQDGVAVDDLQAQLDQCRSDRDRNWTYFVSLCNALNVGANADMAIAEINKLTALEDQYNQKDRQLAEATSQITDLQAKLHDATTQLTTLSATNETLTKKIVDEDKKINIALDQNAVLQKELNDLKENITKPVYAGWKANLIAFISKL